MLSSLKFNSIFSSVCGVCVERALASRFLSLRAGGRVEKGDELPDVVVFEGSPGNPVKLRDVFAGKKGILFGVPGAFTPGCDKTHLPGYVKDFELFKKKGVEVIACVAVNDPFVMGAWGEAHAAQGKVKMLADTQATLAKALKLEFDATQVLGGIRCERFSMIVNDNKVAFVNVEPDKVGLTCSLANVLLKEL
uniref:Peroxiredoxin V n=1 Tax=Stygiella incarcerata TaxID=1712417 RepID=A0A192ZIU0_9EUKA|nr:peroxiredoxin V [Stygiella incarcerata]